MSTITTRRKTAVRASDAVRILNHQIKDDPEMRELVDQARLNAKVARMIYDARTRAKLTQEELARKIGSRQPVIARLEDADYEGHSLSMLQRIASALELQVDVEFCPRSTRR